MDKKSKLLFLVFFLVVVGAMAATYYRYMVVQDYIVQAEAECDPYTEACFVYVCDSSAGEECTGDLVEDTSYYKIIKRNAKNIPACDPAAEGCDALVCPVGEADCEILVCDPTEELEGTCSDPVVYTEENPIEEEEIAEDEEVSEGDEEEEDVLSEEGVTEDTTTIEEGKEEPVGAAEESAAVVEIEKQEGGT